jgi:hypothetical protein
MAMYVVLQVDDDKDWELSQATEEQIVAVVKKPTLYCDPSRHSKRVTGFSRSARWHWFVCAECRKPTRLWGNSYRAVVMESRNLWTMSEPKIEPKKNPDEPLDFHVASVI